MKTKVACLLGLLVMPYLIFSAIFCELTGYTDHWMEVFDDALEAMDAFRRTDRPIQPYDIQFWYTIR